AAYLIRLVLTQNGVDVWRQFQTALILPLVVAVAVQSVSVLITTWRWQMLLGVQGVPVRYWDLVSLSMIGLFFSSILPGAVGGDVLKMLYVVQHAPGRRTEAALTILVDRIMGLLGLCLVAVVSVLFSLRFLSQAPRDVQLATLIVGAGSLAAFAFVLSVTMREHLQRLPGVSPLLGWLARRLPEKLTASVGRIVRAIDLYREQPRVLLWALGISVVTHVVAAWTVYLIGRAFHETNLPLWGYFLATQIANTIAAIPITPNGFGGRDLVLAMFFRAGHVAPAQAGIIPAVNTLVILFWSLLGGVFFVFARAPRRIHVPLNPE
ncbi:MAG: lysylphosphatidylglycerol synthase transmembrane domain-containing protein, partial [Candidatus Eremiobacterota bacterium]